VRARENERDAQREAAHTEKIEKLHAQKKKEKLHTEKKRSCTNRKKKRKCTHRKCQRNLYPDACVV
jgi:hypothetical protein